MKEKGFFFVMGKARKRFEEFRNKKEKCYPGKKYRSEQQWEYE